jgi:ABC-2 type transport system ATP-binding protein
MRSFSEMALMADRLVVIGQGRLLADTTAAGLSSRAPSLEEAFLQLAGDSAQYQARNMS